LGVLLDSVRRLFVHPQWSLIILWLGLATLIVTLLILMWTSWGQSHPFRKCAALSLLVHLLIGVYATTVEIVTAVQVGPPGHGSVINATLVSNDLGGFAEEDGGAPLVGPWDRLSGDSMARPDVTNLARSEVEQPTSLPRRPVDDVPSLAPTPRAGVANGAPVTAPAGKTAEPIEQPTAQRSDPVEPLVAVRMTPDRAAIDSEGSTPLKRDPTKDAGPPLPTISDAGPRADTTPRAAAPAAPADVTNAGAGSGTQNPAGEPAGDATGGATGQPGGAGAGTAARSGSNGEGQSPNPYSLRFSPDKAGVARQHGGSPETEAAVRAGLSWLAANQNPDGRWDPDKFGAGKERVVLGQDRHGAGAKADTGITGLALLAFLAAGHTHLDGKYAKNVQHGLEFLLRSQGRDGNLGGDAETFALMYCHGMASLALSEAYGMTKDKRMEPGVRRAIMYSLSAQHPSTGGWRYQPQETGDLSQLGWQLMALKSAEHAGIAMPERTRDGMVRFLKSVSAGDHGGLASYRPGERTSRAMTAEAMVCREFLELDHSENAAAEAGAYIIQELPSREKQNLYYWYYATLSLYQVQGEHWEQWNEALQTALLKSQEVDGVASGSWNPDGDLWGGYGGRVYSTAMATLCLEVYYRYLPLYVGAADKDRKRK
jgi:hypothetical protein